MKKTYLMLIVTMLVIGFASVATNLVINGTINFGFNDNDFDTNIVFTYVKARNGEANINMDNKSITFETIKLEDVNAEAILVFDVTNKSLGYDALVSIDCSLEDSDTLYQEYINIEHNLGELFELTSGETKTGRLIVTLKKAYDKAVDKNISMVCKLTATPKERSTEGTYIPKEHEYEEIFLKGSDPVLEATSVEGITLAAETGNKKLIPVIIGDDGTVKRADTTKEWYSYEDKKWANAVILEEGVEIPEVNAKIEDSAIESYFVWIPKYRYRIFDMGKYSNLVDSGDKHKQNMAIEIEFGLENTTDAKISESYEECGTPGVSGEDGSCSIGKWMTHPAFTSFGDIKGFWVGKFETGYKQDGNSEVWTKLGSEKNENNPSKIIIKPNAYSWRNIQMINAFNNSFQYERELDSHMMKNTEWGAVAYLSQSIYGLCKIENNTTTCTDITYNANTNFITGYESTDKKYPNSRLSSTNGNNTGIFDMSGGAFENVMSFIYKEDGKTLSYASSGISEDNKIDKKYYDIYKYTINSHIHWERRILGDATGEMGPFVLDGGSINSTWLDFADFNTIQAPIIHRGGRAMSGYKAGIFAFSVNNGGIDESGSYRIVLAPV